MDYDIGIVRKKRIISPDDCYFAVPAASGVSQANNDIVVDGSGLFFNFNGSSNQTFSFTAVPTSDPSAVAIFIQDFTSGLAQVTGITWGGVAMSLIDTQATFGGSGQSVIFALASPPTGSQTVVVSYNGGAGLPKFGGASAVGVTGSNTSTAVDGFGVNSGTGTAVTLSVTSAAGELVYDVAQPSAGTMSPPGAGQTQIGVASGQALSYKTGSAGSTSTSWTDSLSEAWWSHGISFKLA